MNLPSDISLTTGRQIRFSVGNTQESEEHDEIKLFLHINTVIDVHFGNTTVIGLVNIY